MNLSRCDKEARRFNIIANNLDESTVLLESISNNDIKEKLKYYMSQIENLVLQSPEWIYNKGIPGINIGIFGSFNGGWKEVLAVFTEDKEYNCIDDMGIRVKHAFKIPNQSEFLLLIRHESENIPNKEFSDWLDCGIFIFKLENERSFKDALLSHKELVSLRSNDCKYAPMILVGCRDCITPVSPRLKSYIDMKYVAQQYGFDEYMEVRYTDGFNIYFLFEFCTLLANKYKTGNSVTLRDTTSTHLSPSNSSESNNKNHKRKPNKRKTCNEEDFKVPVIVVINNNNKKSSKNAKRNSSINDPPSVDNERRRSVSLFKTKTKSLPRPSAQENSGSFSSSSSLSEQNYATLNRRYVSMIQLPNKKSRWRFFHRKKCHSVKPPADPLEEIIIQGILYKGGNKKLVTITNTPKMFYHNSKHDFEKGIKGKEINLLHSNAKVPGNNCQNGYTTRINKKKSVNEEDKRTITIVTHAGKHEAQIRIFKANSEEERNNWLEKIKDAIYRSYSGGVIENSNKNEIPSDDILSKIYSQYGNDICADCDAKHPKWVVFNFGILVCERCAGGHRKLSTDISKVCSSKLDGMDKVKIQMLESFGNTLVNSVMEAKLHLTDDIKPIAESLSIEEWLHNKYILRKYIPPLPLCRPQVQQQLMLAIQNSDKLFQLICLMNATREQLNLPFDLRDSRTALMIAARVGDIVAVQLLLWAGVNTSIRDNDGLNAHTYASTNLNGEPLTAEMSEIQNLLLKFNTPVQILNKVN